MRLSSYHNSIGDTVTFARGKVPHLKNSTWHRIYISSLFTWELPRTVATAQYYIDSLARPMDMFIGGIAATLMPDYIRERVQCTVIAGPLDKPDQLGPGSPPIAPYVPDYDMVKDINWSYKPEDSYFCRITTGCIRKCRFCAVPRLEPTFGYCQSLGEQVKAVKDQFGEKQHLVLLDNNVLALDDLTKVISDIREQGFGAEAVLNGRQRTVDFNQGIDARLITKRIAKLLSTIALSPVRLAFDKSSVEKAYRKAIGYMADAGFSEFTNYLMFNYKDTPEDFYRRMKVNLELSQKRGIRVTGFPMRYVPIHDVDRHYVSEEWRWRYLRGIQCVLSATHGLVSPNPEFFAAAFGESPEEFIEILSMPDRYIIYRKDNRDAGAAEWRKLYRRLSDSDKDELLELLALLNKSRNRRPLIESNSKFRDMLEHYYPTEEEKNLTLPLTGVCGE